MGSNRPASTEPADVATRCSKRGRTVPLLDFTQNQENTVDPLRQLMTAVLALPVVACAAVGPQQPADAKPAEAPAAQPAPAAAEAPKADAPKGDDTEAEIKKLRTEAQLREEQLAAELARVRAEKARLDAAMGLYAAQQAKANEPEATRLAAMQREAQLRAATLDAELAAGNMEMARMKAEQDLLDMRHRVKLASMRREQEALAAENALTAEKRRTEQARLADEQMRVDIESRTMAGRLAQRDAEQKMREAVDVLETYPEQPFKDGVITVSDRRISLNGPIVSGTADYVCDRIDWFNNQDRAKPIFIVIDNSPGGSVMQGYRIVKAIETSDAPVHVIVKSFAASMAATIATLAPHSYAYPNAIILHHQMSTGISGNMTDIEQEVKMAQEWERRLAEPIARKMGISMAEFKDRMYKAR
ncbi:MAG: ATP-dependent Clp protease proteolytic subunit, partial [Planctomycetes bacterium]|nr:ATP-dependent Clp protease proteolytic subunit [Planctomycetota bacterium]